LVIVFSDNFIFVVILKKMLKSHLNWYVCVILLLIA